MNHLIINPKSGKYYGNLVDSIIKASRDWSLDIYYTCSAGDAEIYTANLDKNVKRIIIAGGDGTIHEVINGLKYPKDILISIIPTGTGNNLARELGITSIPDALNKLCSGKTQCAKIVKVTTLSPDYPQKFRLAVNTIISGLPEQINQTATELGTVWPTFFQSLIGFRYELAALPNLMPPKIDASITTPNGTICNGFTGLFVQITKRSGNGMLITPESSLSDLTCDMVIITNTRVVDLLLLAKFMGGFPNRYKINSFEIHGKGYVTIDGQSDRFHFPIECKVFPQYYNITI